MASHEPNEWAERRARDVFGRLGGKEFALVLAGTGEEGHVPAR